MVYDQIFNSTCRLIKIILIFITIIFISIYISIFNEISKNIKATLDIMAQSLSTMTGYRRFLFWILVVLCFFIEVRNNTNYLKLKVQNFILRSKQNMNLQMSSAMQRTLLLEILDIAT